MKPEELLNKILSMGADEEGIRDRFGENQELFQICFEEFINEPNHKSLREAIRTKNYSQAFASAHALKGLSGNLGITNYYSAICILVESLRANEYDNVDREYAEVLNSYNRLKNILTKQSDKDTLKLTDKSKEKKKRIQLKSLLIYVLIIVTVVFLVSGSFYKINVEYSGKVLEESGQHLINTANQIKIIIEEHISNDCKIANSIRDDLENIKYPIKEETLMEMLKTERDIWDVTELMLFTENGYCVYTNGKTETNDVASEMIYNAHENGIYMTVVDSKITYTIPVETELQYNGSCIAAISVVRNMSSFLENMDVGFYDKTARMYLTEANGIVVSMLTNEGAEWIFNIKTICKAENIMPLNEEYTNEDIFTTDHASSFVMSYGEEKYYLISVPVHIMKEQSMRFFYLQPEKVVNSTMSGFAKQLLAFSIFMIVLFSSSVTATFVFIYINKKREFNKAIVERERMFDLLISNTKTAFALFDIREKQPLYISNNIKKIIGDDYWTLVKTEDGFHMENGTDINAGTIRQANEMLQGWNGNEPFISGYICNEYSVFPEYFECQLYPVEDNPNEYIGIIQNMTSAFEREKITKEAMEMAERSNKTKTHFLSRISHDIRTPMNAIVNMTKFSLENIDKPKKLNEYLHTIRESSEHLLHLINDVLDMSRIESGQTIIASEPFDIIIEMNKQVEIIKPLCKERGLTFITDFNSVITHKVWGDSLKLSQIIMNLLSNAVKFTPSKGAVRFSIREIPSLSDKVSDYRFIVEDNGIGIPKDNLAHIFEPFYRADNTEVGETEGTGLGLSICKSYAEAMGGTIRCESEENEGSTFTVELFFEKAIKEENVITKQVAKHCGMPFIGMRCLVVEDNPTNRIIAKNLLERLGFLIDFAENGAEGADKFAKSNRDTYDVIYMDIQMPIMDGYKSANAIRSCAHPRAKTVPIVAMTANVFAEDIEKARLAGMDAYVGKPILSFDLIDQTNKAISKRKG